MKRLTITIFALALGALVSSPILASHDVPGFDGFGYNYKAKVFVGVADGVDRNLDGTVWSDPTYGNDHLVMKWSTAWDEARFHGAAWTPEAWVDNEWNGQVPGGSGETWQMGIPFTQVEQAYDH